MCGPPDLLDKKDVTPPMEVKVTKKSPLPLPGILWSLDDYQTQPDDTSCIITGVSYIVFLIAIEMTGRGLLEFVYEQTNHPVLADELNRHILARHIGVDCFCLGMQAFLGWQARHIFWDAYRATYGGKQCMPEAGFLSRLYTYQPESLRLCLVFFAYQMKNTYDSIVWQDGWLFYIHHLLVLYTSYRANWPGGAYFFTPYFAGLCELSTTILTLLACFDYDLGVKGLAEAFPTPKLVVGLAFFFAFFAVRIFLWMPMAYYFMRDTANSLKSKDPRAVKAYPQTRAGWYSIAALSALQIFWAGQCLYVANQEVTPLIREQAELNGWQLPF